MSQTFIIWILSGGRGTEIFLLLQLCSNFDSLHHHDNDWAPSKRSHRMMSVALAANLDLTLTVNSGYLYDHLDHDDHLHVYEEYDQPPDQPWLSL